MPNVGIRLSEEQAARLAHVASENGRSVSGEVRYRLRNVIDGDEISVRRAVRAERAGRVDRATAVPGQVRHA